MKDHQQELEDANIKKFKSKSKSSKSKKTFTHGLNVAESASVLVLQSAHALTIYRSLTANPLTKIIRAEK
jgi:hypothetical protein